MCGELTIKTVAERQETFIGQLHELIHENALTHDQAGEAIAGSEVVDLPTPDSEILSTFIYSGFEFREPLVGETVLLICDDGPKFQVAKAWLVNSGGKKLVRTPGSIGYTAPTETTTTGGC